MIKGLIGMASSVFFGGGVGNLLSQWEQAGVFSYVLPFLVIFALVFVILSQMKLFKENRAVNTIIALAVALMALQFDFVPKFFTEVFPRLGVGLAIILVILILIGMFMDPTSPGLMWTLLGIGGVIAIVILINSGDAMGSNIAPWFEQNYAWVIGAIIIVIIFFVIVSSGRPPRPRPPAHHSLGFG